tara:strand:- start:399 stop:665 length:267 start_codon:yes stop_codon:yes gene_type:complete
MVTRFLKFVPFLVCRNPHRQFGFPLSTLRFQNVMTLGASLRYDPSHPTECNKNVEGIPSSGLRPPSPPGEGNKYEFLNILTVQNIDDL